MKSSSKQNISPGILFISILILAFVVRLINIDMKILSPDEMLSLVEAQGRYSLLPEEVSSMTTEELESYNNLDKVIQSVVLGDGGNGIVYISTLHFWIKMAGNSRFAIRFLSLIFGLILVLLCYKLGVEIFQDQRIGLLTMLLCAIHVQAIDLSQETRAYALAGMLTVASTIILVRVMKQQKYSYGTLLLYAILLSLSLLSHYSTVYIFIAHFLIVIFLFRPDTTKLRRFILFLLIPTAVLICWMQFYGFDGLHLISERNARYMEQSALDPDNSFYKKTGIYSLAAGWAQNLLYFSGNTLIESGFRIIQLLPLLAFPLFVIILSWRYKKRKHTVYYNLLFVLVFSSLFYASILSIISGHIIAFQHTYSTFSFPYFILLFSVSLFSVLNANELKLARRIKAFAIVHVGVVIISLCLFLI